MAKINKVQLMFLPSYLSHILQPLDLSCFSPIKGQYRKDIAALLIINDAAPVKKTRFLEAYHKARTESLTKRVILSGWRAAGIVLYNVERVLASSQVSNQIITPPKPPAAPHPLNTIDTLQFQTPRAPQQLIRAVNALQDNVTVPRELRRILFKAGKAIGQANATVAGLEAENARLRANVQDLQPQKKRKRVVPDPNS